MKNHTLILDIGKTNKKLFVFDSQYHILHEESTTLPETTDEDGFQCEDIAFLSQWIKEATERIIKSNEFNIISINFSAYGASLVYINEEGRVVAPLYNYLKPYPEELQQQLYNQYPSLSTETASPSLGSLNSGLQLYRLKYEKPELFKSVKYALHLPQYLSFLLTGMAFSDMTSIGCHTLLWDFNKWDYHDWVYKENIAEKLAPVVLSDSGNILELFGKQIFVGIGLHDSSAALIPYLCENTEPFVLISTGTWSISLNPFNHTPLTEKELNQDCLCYISYIGKPVKASRLFAGKLHEEYVAKLASHFNVDGNFFQAVEFDKELALKTNHTITELPEPSNFNSYTDAYHSFMEWLIAKQIESTNLVLNNAPVKQIFVDGGFIHNQLYMNFLRLAYPNIKIIPSNEGNGSAKGAATAISNK